MTPNYLRPVFTLLFSKNISILTCVSILTLDLKNPPFQQTASNIRRFCFRFNPVSLIDQSELLEISFYLQRGFSKS